MQTTIRFFTSKHCGFCRAAKTILDGIKQSFGESMRVEEVDIDENPRAAIEEGILALPVIIVGSWKFVGVPDKDDIMTAVLNSFGGQTITASENNREILQEGR
ncbi:MAG: thioredoxin family protein [Promethearchaeati archaeon SRVP18_Atabeyarchaeia-1]